MSPDHFKILYRDDHLVAIDKPPGIHVHPTPLSRREKSCMPLLREQLGQWVYPVHRLDRATSGVLLFALSKEDAGKLIEQFQARTVGKQYWAVVRGYISQSGTIDRPLREEKHRSPAEAITEYHRLATVELPLPVGKFPTARYSLIEAFPRTGRKNQIRKHLAGAAHPIVGDVQFGDGRHNRLCRHHFDIHRLLLLARNIAFQHPRTEERLEISAPLPPSWRLLFEKVGWTAFLSEDV